MEDSLFYHFNQGSYCIDWRKNLPWFLACLIQLQDHYRCTSDVVVTIRGNISGREAQLNYKFEYLSSVDLCCDLLFNENSNFIIYNNCTFNRGQFRNLSMRTTTINIVRTKPESTNSSWKNEYFSYSWKNILVNIFVAFWNGVMLNYFQGSRSGWSRQNFRVK